MKNVLEKFGLLTPYRYLKGLMRRLMFCFDGLLLTDVRPKKDIVLIRLDAIGDFIVWLDSAKEFRGIYPTERIVLIANSAWASLAKTMPYWDEVLSLDPVRFSRFGSYRIEWLKKISSYGFRIAIHPANSRMSSVGDSVVRATQAQEKIAPARDLLNLILSARERDIVARWYTKIFPPAPGCIGELERNTDFLNKLTGTENYKTSIPRLVTSIPPCNLGNYFVVVPGAAWQGRMWEASKFCRVIVAIREKFGLKPVLCGSILEKSLCQNIVDEVKGDAVNMAGDTSLNELADLINGAHLVVTNETSAVHFAAATGTPSVCIVGGGHFGRFVPYPEHLTGKKPIVVNHSMSCYNCNWNCTERHAKGNSVPCIEKISVKDVLIAVEKALDHNRFIAKGN
jgi:ADP-heptose:LPS heptosyltransferase